MTADERISLAELAYQRAMFAGDSGALEAGGRALDAVEADVALARGRLVHTRFLRERVEDPAELELFERAAELYRRVGDRRGEGEALFWTGAFHQVVRGDSDTALPLFERARALAEQTGDRLTASYALRHLAFADHMAGRLEQARALFEESTRLRRALGFLPGVAANLIGLAHLAAQQQRRADAARLLDEAAELAAASEAHAVAGWVVDARQEIGLP
ncbi:tetratricopeptide repeat protein [Streptomyces sp. TLI_171]|uniref:tetratricopeptide repeat protein n=1 Tax=Streptomyces sp. TLI_171 TaxID=1938859 RepID=UPI000C19ED9A|nr:tetratricopeptide repeat protein [Streptomyces sp. TLI_171]RKE22490.1 tetratricopeptide repeat protein [Streptomyces sp. TLI_171]